MNATQTRQRARRDPCLCTLLTRQTEEYGPVEIDMIIWFEIVSYSPGCPARIRHDENDYPAEPAEYEFAVTDIEFDGTEEPDDAPGPLTDAERDALTAWFSDHYDEACVEADGRAADRGADRADYEYDRYRDEQMERRIMASGVVPVRLAAE
jgi:hypothetical protein